MPNNKEQIFDVIKSSQIVSEAPYHPGYEDAAATVGRIASAYADGRVLIGGAGGYQPFDHTPAIWASVVSKIHDEVSIFA